MKFSLNLCYRSPYLGFFYAQQLVKKSRGGQTFNSSAKGERNVVPRKLKKKKIGAILIEVAFTLPVVVYLMFFCIELIKINITKEALQSICEEATYLTIAHDYTNGADLIKKIDAIIEKYRPSFIPKEDRGYPGYSTKHPVIRWYYESYSDFSNILSSAPYGGSQIVYPPYEWDSPAAVHGSWGHWAGHTNFIPVNGMECPPCPENWSPTTNYMKGDGLPKNRVFVLTVSCNYPFSSSMVKMLFGGGVNTRICSSLINTAPKAATGAKGSMYLLWARGSGIVN